MVVGLILGAGHWWQCAIVTIDLENSWDLRSICKNFKLEWICIDRENIKFCARNFCW